GRLEVLEDGDELRIGARRLRAVDTPGHASHHHAYHDPDAGLVFTGDVGGIRLQGHRYVCAPTPPPDIDLDAWRESPRRPPAAAARSSPRSSSPPTSAACGTRPGTWTTWRRGWRDGPAGRATRPRPAPARTRWPPRCASAPRRTSSPPRGARRPRAPTSSPC